MLPHLRFIDTLPTTNNDSQPSPWALSLVLTQGMCLENCNIHELRVCYRPTKNSVLLFIITRLSQHLS